MKKEKDVKNEMITLSGGRNSNEITNHHKMAHHNCKRVSINESNKIKKNCNFKNFSSFQFFLHLKKISKNGKIDDKNEDKNDLITLNGCGIVSKWRFPINQKNCPVHTCNAYFKSRIDAIAHYKSDHASNMILCNTCDKPISSGNISNFVNHHRRMHPHHKLPQELRKKVEKSQIGRRNVVHGVTKNTQKPAIEAHMRRKPYTRNISNQPISKMQTSVKILCPLVGCTYEAKRTEQLRDHWKKSHSHLRFPEIKRRSNFTFETNSSNMSSHESIEQEQEVC